MKTRILLSLTVLIALALMAPAFAAKAATKAKTTKAAPVETKQPAQTQPVLNATPTGDAAAQKPNNPQAGEQINWDVIASGGGSMSSVNFLLDGTLGQAIAGPSTSTNYALNAGFWQDFGQGSFLCGDVSVNGRVDISDAVFIVNYIFGAGPAPNPLEAADVNCSDRVDISDCVYLINYIFGGGGAPCAACS